MILVATCGHIFQEEVVAKLRQHEEERRRLRAREGEEGKAGERRS